MIRYIPFLFVVIWSTGWIVAGFAARYADPLWFLFLRFTLAAIAMGLIGLIMRVTFPRDRRLIGHAMVSGVLIHAIYLAGVWWAVAKGVPSGVSGIMAGLQPVMTAMLAPALLGERISPIRLLGVAFGFFGIVLVLLPKLVGVDPATFDAIKIPLIVNFIGMVGVTLGTFYQKRFVTSGDLVATTFWQYVAASLAMLPLVPLFGAMVAEWNMTLILTMAWSVLVLSIGGILLFMTVLKHGEVSRATAFIYLVPPMTALLAFAIFGETLTTAQLGGMAVTALGVFLATRR